MKRIPLSAPALGGLTPLIALDVVVLDTETTGLDIRKDRIVQIGAVRMYGREILASEVFNVLVDPQMPIPEVAQRIHGLGDTDVAGQRTVAEILPELAAFIGGAVVVGHSIHFDLAILRHEAERTGTNWKDPLALDVALMIAGLDPALVDTSLDSLALSLGVDIKGRHTALGDAIATAEVYVGLQPRLIAKGIRTLAEAENLCRKPTGLIARQEEAGWFNRPKDKRDFSHAVLRSESRKAIDSYLYRNRLSDVMSSPPISLPQTAPLSAAASLMAERGIGCLIIDRDGEDPGILTERDVLHALAQSGAGAPDLIVSTLMTAPIISAPADTFLYRALGLMARRNLRYLGVTDGGGRVSGIFTLRTLLRERALATLTVGDEIAAATRPRDLAKVQSALPALASGLLDDGQDARSVCAIIAAEGKAMTARAAELAEAELVAAGAGPAPANYALLVLGSGGRGESMLAADQDNALVIDNAYPGDLDSADDWFTRFAARINEILDRAGIPLCSGGVMARNRPWRRRLSEWENQLADWASHPSPQALLNVDIFYDFTPAHVSGSGGARLAESLRVHAMDTARGSLGMLRALGETAASHGPPLGLFGRIRKDDQGRVDLKAGGLLPLVAGARTIALRYGIPDLATPRRLVAAARSAHRSETDADLLANIHGFLIRLVLTQQIADLQAGIPPSNRVEIARLSHRDQDELREALGRIDLMSHMLRDILQGI